MAEKTPLSFGTVDGDSCGPVSSIVEIPTGDTVASDTIPWTGIIGGTDIDAVYSTTSVTLNSTAAGGGGDLTGIDAGDGITVTDGATTTPEVSVDLKANSGLVIDSTELACDVDGTTINFVGGELHAINNGTVTSVTAGNGLTQTGTSTINPTLAVGAGDGVAVDGTEISLDIKTGSGLKITSEELDFDINSIAVSGCASAITVPAGSSIEVCSTGDPASNGDVLTLDVGAGKAKWKQPAFVMNLDGQIVIGQGNTGGYLTMSSGGQGLISRSVHVANDLSGHADLTTTLDSSASISGCPFPNPFSHVAAGADLGTGVDNFYFGSGVSRTETTMGTDGISFDDTNGYWDIAVAGWYEVQADISILVTSSPATVTDYVITTTGYGGTEAVKALMYQELRTNIDPHYTMVRWMGYLAAGVKVAIKCDTDAGTIKSKRGSSASVKRIG